MKKENNFRIEKPNLPENLKEYKDIEIKDEDSFSMGFIENKTLDGTACEHVAFNKFMFKDVSFRDCVFKNIELTDTVFLNCDLANADLSGAIIHRSHFITSKITGVNLSEATLRNCILKNLSGEYAYFGFSDIKHSKFTECIFRDGDFSNSKFNGVIFEKSLLTRAQMSGTKLRDIDFTSCDIAGLGLEISDAYGMIVTSEQAVYLSSLMGLVIKNI